MNTLVVIAVVALAALLALPSVGWIWYVNIVGFSRIIRGAEKRGKKEVSDLVCSIDTDCPPGYVCMNGRCMKAA